MQHLLRSACLILHRQDYSETSLIIKAFTRESGSVSFLVKGAKRKGSGFGAVLDYFNQLEILYRPSVRTELWTLREASMAHEYRNLKSKTKLNALAYVILEVMLRYLIAPEPSGAIFSLLENSLLLLDESDEQNAKLSVLLCDFLLSLTEILGFRPQFESCALCSGGLNAEQEFFDLDMGGSICQSCLPSSQSSRISIKPQIRQWLRHIQSEGRAGLKVKAAISHEAENLLLAFLGYHCGTQKNLRSLSAYQVITSS